MNLRGDYRSTPIAERAAIVERFQTNLKGPKQFALLVLSPKAAGAGLTLTAATHIIHLSRWWNPAVEEQCNDRAHRIGQSRPVCIHIPMAVHSGYLEQSFDCLLHVLMTRKRQLAQSTLWPTGSNNDMVTGLRAGLFTSSAVGVRGHQQDTINAVMQSLSEKTNEILRLDDQEGRYRIER